MKIPIIKKLVDNYSEDQLKAAELAIIEEETPQIEIGGDDEGEQLTHVIAAIWILGDMRETGDDYKTSLRKYTQRVRSSID